MKKNILLVLFVAGMPLLGQVLQRQTFQETTPPSATSPAFGTCWFDKTDHAYECINYLGQTYKLNGVSGLTPATFASPPAHKSSCAADATGCSYIFTDSTSPGVCSGGGSSYSVCVDNGTSFVAASASSSGGTGNAASKVVVAFSATPAYACTSASAGTVTNFLVGALTGNITSSTTTGCTVGQYLGFTFTQDATGGRTVAMPPGFDACPVNASPASVSNCLYWLDASAGHLIGNSYQPYAGLSTANVMTASNDFSAATWKVPNCVGGAASATNMLCNASGPIHYWTGLDNTIGTIPYPAAGIAVSAGSAWGTSLAAPVGAVVGAGQANTFTTGLQNFTAATWEIPNCVGGVASASNMLCNASGPIHFWNGSDNVIGTGGSLTIQQNGVTQGTATTINIASCLLSAFSPGTATLTADTTCLQTIMASQAGVNGLAISTSGSGSAYVATTRTLGDVISSATAANPMVLTLAYAPSPLITVGSSITIVGATGTGASAMNGVQTVTNVSGSNVTISLNGTGITYTGSSGSAYVAGAALTGYTPGMRYFFFPDTTATGGATTLAIDGLAAIPVKESDCSTNPTSSDIVASKMALVWYNPPNFCLLALGSGTSGITQLTGDVTAGPGSGSQAATLATVSSTSGSCGDATHVCQVTTNAKGLTTSQSAVPITFPTSNIGLQPTQQSVTSGVTTSVVVPLNTTLTNASQAVPSCVDGSGNGQLPNSWTNTTTQMTINFSPTAAFTGTCTAVLLSTQFLYVGVWSGLPTPTSGNPLALVTNAASAGACGASTGTSYSICAWSGSAWVATSGTGTGGTGNAASAVTISSTTGTVGFNCPSATAGTVNLFQAASGPITLTGNLTMTSSGCTVGQEVSVYFQQAASGGPYTITVPTGWDTIQISQIASVATLITWSIGSSGNGRLHGAQGNTGVSQCSTTTAPSGNPPSGMLYTWCDSTANTYLVKDSSGNVYAAVKSAATRTANQFATYINASGVVQTAAITTADLPGSGAATVNGVTCTLGAACAPYGGATVYTTSHTIAAADIGKLVVMNCAAACTVTMEASPAATDWGGIETIGASVATVSLNTKTYNGSASVPVLNSFRDLRWASDGTNYFGDAPLVAGTNVTLTPAANGLTVAASATGSTAFSALTGSTNTTAAMLVGTGASLGPTGSGTVTANAASGTVVAQKFFGTAAPASVAGNLPGDTYNDTTNHKAYICNAPSGTAAPACTSVTAGGWTEIDQGSGGSTAPTMLAWNPWGYGYGNATTSGGSVAGTANYGASQSFYAPGPLNVSELDVQVAVASGTSCTGGTCGLIQAIASAPTTSTGTFTLLCITTPATSGGAVDINTTGLKRLTFGSGPNVSGGTCALTGSAMYVVLTASDSVALKLVNYQNGGTSGAGVINQKYPWTFTASGSPISSGNGASLAFNGSITGANIGVSASAAVTVFEVGLNY